MCLRALWLRSPAFRCHTPPPTPPLLAEAGRDLRSCAETSVRGLLWPILSTDHSARPSSRQFLASGKSSSRPVSPADAIPSILLLSEQCSLLPDRHASFSCKMDRSTISLSFK